MNEPKIFEKTYDRKLEDFSNFTLRKLSDSQLNLKVKSLVSAERKLTKEILIYIAEVDKRKLYLGMAYPSLFEYLVKEVGYSAGSAQRRIDSARLIQRIPEVSNQIEKGSLNMAQISKMQKACRQLKKETGKSIDYRTQKSVLKKLEGQGTLQTDIIIAKEFNCEIASVEKLRAQSDESIRLEVTFTKEEMETIKKAQSILSNKTGSSLKETILEMAKSVIKKSESKPTKTYSIETKPNEANPAECNQSGSKKSTATVASKTALKSVTPKLKKTIINRDKFCQFKDKISGNVCGSQLFLQIDHIQPRYDLGGNEVENLRVLCSNHNKYRYEMGL